MIEFADNVSFTGESVDSDMFKIPDPLTGRLIGITPDLTIQTARLIITFLLQLAIFGSTVIVAQF